MEAHMNDPSEPEVREDKSVGNGCPGNGVGHHTPEPTNSTPIESNVHDDPIVIVGIGLRLPGGISKPSDLWDLLYEERSGRRAFGKNQFNIEGYYHPNAQRPGSIHTKEAYLLRDSALLFDHTFFGVNSALVASMDPNQRKMLEVVYEAFESAGEPLEKVSGANVGVFVGNMAADNQIMLAHDIDFAPQHASTGMSTAILSNRINHMFNLRGPSLTIDTACASSMYALHLAVNSIRNGDCDTAIVGGSNLIMGPEVQLLTAKLGALSPTSTCHTFDASADGYGRAEGFGALYLMRLSDATSGGYPRRALIRGTAVNANGRTAGISHPSADGQEALIRRAYKAAKLTTGDTTYFECHGTGTPVGDPVEISAISKVFGSERVGKPPLLIGSVKTNLGHSEAVSGLVGIVKTILAMEKGFIPATIGVRELNPNIDFEAARVKVVTQLTPWPQAKFRRASVNSFGYGGANAHCILENVPSSDDEGSLKKPPSEPHRLVVLPFSAHDPISLAANISAAATVITQTNVLDLAYTLFARRSIFRNKAFVIAEGHDSKAAFELSIAQGHNTNAPQTPRIAFIFTGQGAQWAGMGAELFVLHPFSDSIRRQDEILQQLSDSPSWRLKDVLDGSASASIQDAIVSQAACTALQIALVDLLRYWGVAPSACIGHSSGEIAAAYASGKISLAEAITTAYYRGYALATNSRRGSMLAVGMTADSARELISGMEGEVKIAAINSPSSVTLSGNVAEIARLETGLKQKNVFARILRTGDNAYHSHHMTGVGITYEALLLRDLAAVVDKSQILINPVPMDATWISSVSPDKQNFFVDSKAAYWRKNLELPVQFLRAVENMLSRDGEAPSVIIEIGPHATLRSPLQAIFAQVQETRGFKVPTYLSALRRHENGSRNILELCGHLFCLNHTLNLQKVNTTGPLASDVHGQVSIELPPYRYNYGDPIHHESRIFREIRDRRYLHHDILGVLQPGCARDRPSWRNVLRLKDIPWLADHQLIPQIIFPAAGYIALATEALAQYHHRTVTVQDAPIFRLRNVSIKTPMEIPKDDEGVEILIHLQVMTPGSPWHSFLVSSVSKDSSAWTEHASGLVAIQSDAQQRLKMPKGLPTPHYFEAKEWYEKFFQCGLGYGPSFQGLSDLCCYPIASVTTAAVSTNTTRDMFNGPESRHCIHPCTLDSCFQLLPIAAHGGQTKSLQSAFLPIGIEELTIWPSVDEGSHARAVAFARRAGLRGGRGDIQLFSQDGKPRVEVVNMQCIQYQGGPAIDKPTQVSAKPYSQLIWKPDISTLTKGNATAMFPTGIFSYDHGKGSSHFEMRRVLDLLSHKNPSMKIIGVGTNSRSVTEAALEVLGGATPASRKFSKYTYTDQEIQMDQSMQKAMARCKDISHQPLAIQDFSNKKTDQGEYDLVIARANHELGSNNLDAFRSIRQLLGPGGHLLVVEATGSGEEWNHILKLSNFEGVDLHLDDDQLPFQATRTIVATASLSASSEINQNPDQLLLVITDSLEDQFATALISAAINAGVHAELITFKDADIRSGSRVILTARPNHHPLLNGSESEFQALKNIISHSSSILFLTDGDILRGSNPQASVLTGLVRMLVTEDAASRFGILHMEEGYSMSDSALLQAVLRQESNLHSQSGRNESEVAMFNGIAHIPRLIAHTEMNETYQELNPEKQNVTERSLSNREPLQLDFELPGVLSSQYFRPNTSFNDPLPETWIEVEVRSAGLNWKDIAAVTGKIDLDHFSHECSGIVLACGTGVHGFSPEDRVYGVALSRFGNIVRAPAGFLQLMPDDSTFSEMATMPVAFVSALYSLLHLGRLERGQRVLIQSAAGGVGLAAIQIARHAGAEIYATVSTKDKIEYLVNHCKIPRNRIFDSRSAKEVPRMMSETEDKKFDIILSSSSGNSMQEAIQCLARRGVFIDLAREDIMKHRMLPMDLFARSATFTSFDLDDIAIHEPEFLTRLIKEMDHLRKSGCLHPLPFTEFDISTLNQAFLHLSKAVHVGKVVVGYKPESSMIKQLDVPNGAKFRRGAVYVLVGGLRGVGRSVVHWMVSRGARKIAVFNRSGSACPEALSLIGELANKGADLEVVKCDVTITSQVESAIDTAAAQGPIKGILHAAAVYKDGVFNTLSYDRWKLPLSVKVQGSMNLHEVAETRRLDLDFFVMISSIEAVVALPSQAAYCAGNCFQDAFARYRRSIGRPATSIAFGLISEISVVGQWASARGTIARNGLYPIGEYDLLRLLEGIFAERQSHHADVTNFDLLAQAHIVCCLDPEELAKQIPEHGSMNTQAPRWHSDAKFSHTLRTMTNYLLDNDAASEPERDIPSLASEVDHLISRGNREEAARLVTSAIIEQAASLLEVASGSIDSRRSIAHYGMDSLLAVELRNWMTHSFHDAIPLLKLLDETISIEDLGEMILVKQERS